MQRIALTDSKVKDFVQACRTAVGKAGEMLDCPVIVAWKDDRNGRSDPEILGAKADRWHDYGKNNDRVLELEVANDYHFVFTEAEAFEESDLNVTPEDNETRFVCINNACVEADKPKLGYFAGTNLGGQPIKNV